MSIHAQGELNDVPSYGTVLGAPSSPELAPMTFEPGAGQVEVHHRVDALSSLGMSDQKPRQGRLDAFEQLEHSVDAGVVKLRGREADDFGQRCARHPLGGA